MVSLDLVKLIESRQKTIKMLEDRISELSKPEYKGALREVVRVAEQRLVKVRAELVKFLELRDQDGRQAELPAVRKARP
ncbi:putative VP5 [Microviridae sp.]|nr:putative VP5 [Microviridae sp.]